MTAPEITPDPATAYEIIGATRPSRWLLTCDHAANTVPDWVADGDLGVDAADMARHIAYDVGAAGLTRALADLLNAPAILSRFSRLVIDPNRGEDDPTLIMKLYDGTIIPANRHLTEAQMQQRRDRLYRPYHAAVTDLTAARTTASGHSETEGDAVVLAVHSFTQALRGRSPRPWHVGVLYGPDDRLARPLIARLRDEPDLCIGDNEPYAGYLPGDAIDRHALLPGRLNVLIEVRNDLIGTPDQQLSWAVRLAPILEAALTDAAS